MAEKLTNENIARLLRQVSAAYTIKGINRFRIIAYDKASEAVEKSNIEVKDLWDEGRLSNLPGIGPTIAGHLDELFKTGRVKRFEKAFQDLPQGMFPLLDVPGIGPKSSYKLAREFKLHDAGKAITGLLKAAQAGKIAKLDGFGEKSQADILDALKRFKKGQVKKRRMSLPYAGATADQMLIYLKKSPAVVEAVPLGSLRRGVSTIGDIDIGVATENPGAVLEWFTAYPKKSKIVETGPTGATILLETGQQIDIRVQSPVSFGAMFQYFTGSKEHNIRLREFALRKGFSLSEYGIKKTSKGHNTGIPGKYFNKKLNIYEFPTEEEFYHVLGLPWIPPEIRENSGEIEKAVKNRLPRLIELKDIKGEVHVHSDYNLKPSHDLGSSSLEDLLKTADGMGYEYLGISDHNPRLANHTEKDIELIMKGRKDKYEHILVSNKNVRVKLFIMLEVDILPDGKLALPERAFQYVDAVVVSVHSSFGMSKEKMTDRIIKGLSYPKAKILGHPTGRLIASREGYEVNWQKVFDFCKKYNKALEINSYPDRLDLPDVMVKRAIENGNKLVIDTDSHHTDQMRLIAYGVTVARRGWAEKSDILNTLPYNEFKSWLTA